MKRLINMAEPSNPDDLQEELDKALSGGRGPSLTRLALTVIGGVVPYAGGVLGAAVTAWSEKEQKRFNGVFAAWLKLQEDELKEIGRTMAEILLRLDPSDDEIMKRLESPEYLKIAKKAFRDWSAAESENKRVLIRNLLANAAATAIASDDVVRLFIEWIDKYSDLHFKVIAEIYKHPGITRGEIWKNIRGDNVREDSADADLFKLMVQDLSVGHIARQHREKDIYGNFQKGGTRRKSGSSATSAFDDDKEYELTELGKQFVHYTMNEIVPRIVDQRTNNSQSTN